MDIFHMNLSMMKFYQALHIIETDSGTPAILMGILRIRQLVIALENILYLIFCHRLPAIEDRNLQSFFICRSLDADDATRSRILEGIGEKIAHDFFQLVTIQPCMVIAILYCQFQSDAFHSGRFFKRSNLLTQLFSSIHFRNSQAKFIGFQLVEVEHLVYQPQHSVHTHTDMIQGAMHRIWQGFICIQRHQRSGYDGKRITEFVSNIGKEPHIHLLSLLFAFQFALLLQKQKMIGASPEIERVEIKENTKKDAEIKQPSCR